MFPRHVKVDSITKNDYMFDPGYRIAKRQVPLQFSKTGKFVFIERSHDRNRYLDPLCFGHAEFLEGTDA